MLRSDFSLSGERGHHLTEHLLAESLELNFSTMSVYSSVRFIANSGAGNAIFYRFKRIQNSKDKFVQDYISVYKGGRLENSMTIKLCILSNTMKVFSLFLASISFLKNRK